MTFALKPFFVLKLVTFGPKGYVASPPDLPNFPTSYAYSCKSFRVLQIHLYDVKGSLRCSSKLISYSCKLWSHILVPIITIYNIISENIGSTFELCYWQVYVVTYVKSKCKTEHYWSKPWGKHEMWKLVSQTCFKSSAIDHFINTEWFPIERHSQNSWAQ